MVIRSVCLETVCGITSKLPVHTAPEFAFAGRSNVGKSSLINSLLNRKSFARVSQEPGKTQTINYYKVNDAFYFTDLPGYGYAKVSKEVREKWGRMTERYLRTSGSLKAVFLLIDIRRGPNADDILMYQRILESGNTPAVLLTKSDKVSRNEQARTLAAAKKTLNIPEEGIILPFSSATKAGRDAVYAYLDGLLEEKRTETSQAEAGADGFDK